MQSSAQGAIFVMPVMALNGLLHRAKCNKKTFVYQTMIAESTHTIYFLRVILTVIEFIFKINVSFIFCSVYLVIFIRHVSSEFKVTVHLSKAIYVSGLIIVFDSLKYIKAMIPPMLG